MRRYTKDIRDDHKITNSYSYRMRQLAHLRDMMSILLRDGRQYLSNVSRRLVIVRIGISLFDAQKNRKRLRDVSLPSSCVQFPEEHVGQTSTQHSIVS
jgi:hypothetical protein